MTHTERPKPGETFQVRGTKEVLTIGVVHAKSNERHSFLMEAQSGAMWKIQRVDWAKEQLEQSAQDYARPVMWHGVRIEDKRA